MGAVVITQTANPAGVTADGSFTSTYSALSLGAESLGRIIAVLIGKEVASITLVAVYTSTGIVFSHAVGNEFGNMGAYLLWEVIPTGTEATINIEWSGAITNLENHIAVYSITGSGPVEFALGSDLSSDMDATDALTTGSSTIPTNGGMIAIAVGATDTVAKTWANLTEDIDADAGAFRFTTATSTTAGTATRTCTGGTNDEDGVLAWVTFSESVLPTGTIMPPLRAS